MKLWFWDRPETEEERYERLAQHFGEIEELAEKSPDEVVGHPLEKCYYLHHFQRLWSTASPEEIRIAATNLLERYPTDAGLRFIVAMVYLQHGDEAEHLAQLGFVLALEPDNFSVHRHFARALMRRGEPEAARKVLENGWDRYQRLLPRKEHAEKRARLFSILSATPAATPTDAD